MSRVDSFTEAGGLTRRYVSALGAVGWLKLGVVLLFLGGFGVSNQVFRLPVNAETVPDPGELWIVGGVTAVGLVIYLAFRYLAALLEFVFVESLRSQALSIRLYLRSNLGSGLRLWGFRLALRLATLAVVAVPIGWTVVAGNVTEPADVTTVQTAAIGVTAVLALFGLTTTTTLTNMFVVPIMLQERRGVVSGWRRFVDAMAANKTGVVAVLLVAWLIGVVLWVGLRIVGFVVGLVGIIGLAFGGEAVAETNSAFEPLVVVAFLVGFLGYQYATKTLLAPVRSYVRYYALVVLGNAEARLDLVPAQRAAIRADTDEPDDASDTDDTTEPAAADGPATPTEPVETDDSTAVEPVEEPTETEGGN